MTYAHIDEVREGDVLISDGGFTCITANKLCTVKRDVNGTGPYDLYVDCSDGHHYIDGQAEEDGFLVGFTKA